MAYASIRTDKPCVKNTAVLMNPLKSRVEEKAEEIRQKVINAVSVERSTGSKWYLSENGDDNASGDSPETAWKTLKAIAENDEKIKYGDSVLMERGSVFRGSICPKSGVLYGAYGSGDKPCIYGSRENSVYAVWTDEGENIWKLETVFPSNVGNVIINHGEAVGFKKLKPELMEKNLDFYFNMEENRLYLYHEGNPAESYWSIEIAFLEHIMQLPEHTEDLTIDNLTMKYGGAHAIMSTFGAKNIRISNCEIGWIGGCILPGYGDNTTRYGNGIEFWQGCENAVVENCWIYQIYDSGLTHQGNGDYVVKNLTFRDNLIEYCCFGCIEYWHDDAKRNSIENVLYQNNILRFAGYGWGAQRSDDGSPTCIIGGGDSKATDFNIIDNVCELSSCRLIWLTSNVNTLPVLNGNTYIQTKGMNLALVEDKKVLLFDDDVLETCKTRLGDLNAKVEFAL